MFSSSSNDSPHDPTTACRRPAGCFGLLVCSITTHGKDAAVSLCVHPVLRPNTTTPLERHVHSKMTIQEYSIIITPGFQGILTFFQKHRQTAAPLRPFVFFLFQCSQKTGKTQERPVQKKKQLTKAQLLLRCVPDMWFRIPPPSAHGCPCRQRGRAGRKRGGWRSSRYRAVPAARCR